MNFFLLLISISALASNLFAIRVPLPFGAGVEGVSHVGGGNFVLSDLLNGKILYYDSQSDLLTTIVQGMPGRSFQGIKYHKQTNYIFAAGSGKPFANTNNAYLNISGNPYNFQYEAVPAAMHVYNFTSAQEVGSCLAPDDSVLVNDVEIDWRGRYAYWTDSARPYFYRMDVAALPKCVITKINLPEEFDAAGFLVTGFVRYQEGLIFPHFAGNRLWYFDFKTMDIYPIVDADVLYGNQVGLAVYQKCLVTADNRGSKLNVYRLGRDAANKVTVEYVRALTGRDISEPSTISITGNTMIATSFNNTILGAEGNIWLTKRYLPPPSALC